MDHGDDSLSSYGVPDVVCEKAGMCCVWSSDSRFSLFAYKHPPTKTRGAPTEFASKPTNIHRLKTASILYDHVARKLVNESNGTFVTVQKLGSGPDIGASKPQFLKLSRQYRSIIKACIENLNAEAERAADPSVKLMYQNMSSIFRQSEFIWNLCELLFIDAIPGGVILPQLLDWIWQHSVISDGKIRTEILQKSETQEHPGSEGHPDYWSVVTQLVLHGRTEFARELLLQHSKTNSEPFRRMDAILKKMPLYSSYGPFSLSEFSLNWRDWRNTCLTAIHAEEFANHKKLLFLAKIMAGDVTAFQECIKEGILSTWFEFLVAWLLFTDPAAKVYTLAQRAEESVAKFGGIGNMSQLDSVIFAAMEGNVLQVLKELMESTDSGWSAGHLADLIFHCGYMEHLDKQTTGLMAKLREYILLEYGTLLMEHHSLWECGSSYLVHCSTGGIARLEILLSHVNPSTEARAHKIIQIATQCNLGQIVVSVCKVVGTRAMREGRLGSALTWALRAQDADFATLLANRILESYSTSGHFSSTDLLDNLGSCMLISDRLTFLGKYREFHQLYHESKFKTATSLLVSLLSSKMAPKYFWMSLLMDALPLLESDKVVFTAEQTYELMQVLNELKSSDEKRKETPEEDEREKILRAALNRNLARALLTESSVEDNEL